MKDIRSCGSIPKTNFRLKKERLSYVTTKSHYINSETPNSCNLEVNYSTISNECKKFKWALTNLRCETPLPQADEISFSRGESDSEVGNWNPLWTPVCEALNGSLWQWPEPDVKTLLSWRMVPSDFTLFNVLWHQNKQSHHMHDSFQDKIRFSSNVQIMS